MRAVVIHAAKDLRVENFDDEDFDGENLSPHQVRIRIEAGGICGSDLHYFHAGGFGAVRVRQPMILGHEVAGVIAEVGDAVANLSVGERVAVNPSRPCGACGYCRRGAANHCLDMRFYGSAMRMPHIHGAFRSVLVANAGQCHPVPADMPAAVAAMAEPLSVCLHAARRAGALLGQRVLITGAGPIGVICAIVARQAGACEIVATDIAEPPLAFMRAAGVDRAVNILDTPDALAPYARDKGTFDVHFEASGSASALAGAVDVLRPGATIVQVGLGGTATLAMNTIVAKELVLKGSFRFHEEFATAVDMMAAGLIDVSSLVTATLPLDEAVAAFELAGDRSKAMKVQLAFN